MSARRRGGKPNRGGGRFNKHRGGGGSRGGGGKKGGAGYRHDDDDFCLNFGPARSSSSPFRQDKGRGSHVGFLDRGRGCARDREMNGSCNDEALRRSLARIEMGRKLEDNVSSESSTVPFKKIFMAIETQEKIKELLQYLKSPEHDETEGEDEEFDELDHRNEGQFWATNDDPVEGEDSPAYEPDDSDGESPNPGQVISRFAEGKLCRYGFNRERSKQALEAGGGEFGATLEYLLLQVFLEHNSQKTVCPDRAQEVPMDECLIQRQEEALVLSAIYGERFSERIANAVWTVKLDLPFLSGSKSGEGALDRIVKPQKLCQFYLKGKGCRFGNKCRFKHQLPTNDRPEAGPLHLTGPTHPGFSSYSLPEYELEIRFPKGNRYPFQAPIVAFSTTDESAQAAGRLSVTERLFEEALAAAKTSEPVVYTLVTLCEDEKLMRELLAVRHHKYSTPPAVVTSPLPYPAITKVKSERSKAIEDGRRKPEQPNDHRAIDDDEDDDAVPVEKRMQRLQKHSLRMDNLLQENGKLCRDFQSKQSNRRFAAMMEQRRKLPAFKERENILRLVEQSQVLVVSGMTGCGKTTQIPQFILDASLNGSAGRVANIICTQPRRISAISVAQRVAQERAERLGHSVGYQIRLESVRSDATRLLYCTTGVLLRRLSSDADLRGITHVIVDEVHERTEESDFLLLVLKDLIAQRSDLKIILMSATLNANLFSEYFYNCPSIHIPGRTFPVDQFFLEDIIAKTKFVMEDGSQFMRKGKQHFDDDVWNCTSFYKVEINESIPDQQLSLQELRLRYQDTDKSVLKTIAAMDLEKINMDLVEDLLEWILDGNHDYPPGAVLVFLPGMAEIKTLYDRLMCNRMFRDPKRCAVHPLHSTLSSEEQQAVFSRPLDGVTKMILSTNIAETSVTIDDVVYVIDTGKMKENSYDASKCMESLEETWVSRANALQRKGRAGRVASGVCFHLFTSHCFQHQLPEQQLPEIQRVPLEQLCLRIKVLDVFSERMLESVFSRLIEPPATENLNAAKQRLQDLGALAADEMLTPLGYHLACLPVDLRIGKLILFGAIFRCLDPALTIAASLAFKSPFVCPFEKRDEANEKKRDFALANSDDLALLQAYKGWCSAARSSKQAGFHYCRENFLSSRSLQEIASLKRQFAELLSDIGFIKQGLRARVIERMGSHGSDGVLEATGPKANLNSDNIRVVSAMLCAALYPNVVQVQGPQRMVITTDQGERCLNTKAEPSFVTKNDGCVHVHPSSVNYGVRDYNSPYLVYHEKVKTSRVFIRDCSMVSAYPLVLFGGGKIHMELRNGKFVIALDDGWIRFAAESRQVADLLVLLRGELDLLLKDKISRPSMDLCSCPRGSRIIDMIVHLISTE